MIKYFFLITSLLNKPQKIDLLKIFFLILIAMLLETFSISLVIPLITSIVNPESILLKKIISFTYLDPNKDNIIIYAAILFTFIFLIKTLFLIYFNWKRTKFVYATQHFFSKKIFDIYLNQPYSFHIKNNSAQLLRNATSEVGAFTNAINSLSIILSEIFIVFGVLFLAIFFNPIATISIFIFFTLIGLLYYSIVKNMTLDWGKKRIFNEGKRIQDLQQGFSNIQSIKVSNKENFFVEKYALHNFMFITMTQYANFLGSIPRLLIEFIAIFFATILIIFLLKNGSAHDELIVTFALFAAIAFKLLPSLNRIISNIQSLRYVEPTLDVLDNELKLENKKKILTSDKDLFKLNKDISFDKVSFCYPGTNKDIINNVSFSINKGEITGIIGESGSGKSTALNLILGLLEPTSGNIKIDGKLLTNDNTRYWQQNIGFVPQQITLIDDTLKNNIAFGIEENLINIPALQNSISLSQLTEFINQNPDRLDSLVGERGITLSGGQIQRIGIARALYNSPSLLILDEPTSSLDTETEKQLINDILKLKKDRTIVIISHNKSITEICQKVISVKDSKIVEYII
jgi:ATP-binding cassette, subfamily B, bacterial PglK